MRLTMSSNLRANLRDADVELLSDLPPKLRHLELHHLDVDHLHVGFGKVGRSCERLALNRGLLYVPRSNSDFA